MQADSLPFEPWGKPTHSSNNSISDWSAFIISYIYICLFIVVSPELITAMSPCLAHNRHSVNICQIMKPEFWRKLLALILISCLTQANHILMKSQCPEKMIKTRIMDANSQDFVQARCNNAHMMYQSHHCWNFMLLFLFQNPKWMGVLVLLLSEDLGYNVQKIKSAPKELFLCYSIVNY